MQNNNTVDMGTTDTSLLNSLVATTVLLVALFSAHHVGAPPHAFLDIACIEQSDASKKASGIEQLGGVLDRTRVMVCLIDEHYWTRLWHGRALLSM